MRDEFYRVDTSAEKRESFNNAILLLTMVRSEYYYIIGFSRLKGQIEIGFDYRSDIHSTITESVIADFYSDDDRIILSGEIKNIDPGRFACRTPLPDNFYWEKDVLRYSTSAPRDGLIPVSIEKMNAIILRAKNEVFAFLENCYISCIRGRTAE